MLFFCFSSKDRLVIVESLLFHLDEYFIPIWYDRREMLMSDPRDYKNFVEGVNNSNYAVIFLSPNSIMSKCANEEIELIRKKHENGNMTVFPILYDIAAESLPLKYKWLTKLVYKELCRGSDTIRACNHIVCKILLDELNKYPILSLQAYIDQYEHVPMHLFTIRLIKSYKKMYKGNYNARMAILYSIYMYITSYYDISGLPQFYYRGIEYLFDQTKLALPIEQRELLIMERLVLLILNGSMYGTTIQYRNNYIC